MPRTLLIAVLPWALAAAGAAAQPIGAPTSAFIAKARATDAFELEAGRLAQKRGQNPQVRAFGAMMLADHTMTTNALRQALLKAHLPMPGKPSPDPTQAKVLADLRAGPEKGFDRAYVHSQVSAHEQALKLMKDYAAVGDNPDVKAVAAMTAPMVERHLKMARDLEFKVGGTTTGLARHED
jgi:putative membrane protein